MEKEVEDELIATVLQLVAETKALRAMIGFLPSDNPNAFARLKAFASDVDGLTLQFPLTEHQRDHLRESLAQAVATVQADPYRWKLGAPGCPE